MKLTFNGSPITFVDVEASTLDQNTFPIEIGWSTDDDQPPQAFLIKPTEGWGRTDAYEAGLHVHKIPYDALVTQGLHILDIPKRLNEAWRGALLISDNPQFDAAWINQVYEAQNRASPWRLIEFDVLFSSLYQHAGLSLEEVHAIVTAADAIPRPHRAGPDSLRLHRIARMIIDPIWRAKFTK